MKYLSVRELKTRSANVWHDLPREQDMIVTHGSKPVAILASVNERNCEETLSALRQARAIIAINRLQQQSVRAGTDRLTDADIAAEITAARKERARARRP